jgi:hypothetical protein
VTRSLWTTSSGASTSAGYIQGAQCIGQIGHPSSTPIPEPASLFERSTAHPLIDVREREQHGGLECVAQAAEPSAPSTCARPIHLRAARSGGQARLACQPKLLSEECERRLARPTGFALTGFGPTGLDHVGDPKGRSRVADGWRAWPPRVSEVARPRGTAKGRNP